MIRKATLKDIDPAYEVILDAKKEFARIGSSQWQDSDGYPSKETLLEDLKNEGLFVIEENEKIIGVTVFCFGIDPSYVKIYNGKWLLDTDNYMTIHRTAILKEKRHLGYAQEIMDYAKQYAISKKVKSIRADTMVNNLETNRLLLRNNYTNCGIIYLIREDVLDSMRLAYELVL